MELWRGDAARSLFEARASVHSTIQPTVILIPLFVSLSLKFNEFVIIL